MVEITAQVSQYPLHQEALGPETGEVLQILRGCALEVGPDTVSTLLVGDATAISSALRQSFCHAAEGARW